MRQALPFSTSILLFLSACATSVAPLTPAASVPPPAAQGLRLDDEATVLRLEDRREFDPLLASAWLSSPNPLQRSRMALALGRIGPFEFIDGNHNFERDPGEKSAGVDLLTALARDPDPGVRLHVALALGEIGDSSGLEALFDLARDAEHAGVAAEALEAIAKMAAAAPLDRYEELTRATVTEGVRARALRYLFRFNSDPASEIAAKALADPSIAIRREAAYALSRRGYAPSRGRLELLLTDPDTLTRSYAARGLGLVADATSFDPLLASLMDAHPWVRTNALRSLSQILGKNGTLLQRPSMAADAMRMETVLQDADPGTRATAIDAVGRYAAVNAGAKEKLVHLAAEGSRWERELALGALARSFGTGAGSPVTDALMDEGGAGAKRAVIDGTAALPAGVLVRAHLFTDPDAPVRAAAIGAIPDDAVDGEVELVRRALSDGDVIVRANALDRYALQKKDGPAATLAALREGYNRGANDPLDDARLSALQRLGTIDFPEREGFLRQALNDRDPVIRRNAAELLRDQLHRNLPRYTPLPIDRPLSEYAQIVSWSRQRHTATIEMPRGEIRLLLLSQDAPMTAWNFAGLAAKHYFDNTSFMRVVPNFVIQGGDPRNDMSGGPGYSIRDEINLQKYTRGAVGMALSGPDTGGSQFFVTHSPQPHLDGGYTIFARVVGGMASVVDQVERGDRVTSIRIDAFKLEAEPPATADDIPLPTEIGPITAERLAGIVPGYPELRAKYTPDAAALELLSTAVATGDRVEVFLGTWCSDSQREVPKYLKILDTLHAGGVDLPTTYFAVDRSKTQPSALVSGKSIEKVATFIYYRGGKEVGRIVETPTGLLEDDLLRMASGKP